MGGGDPTPYLTPYHYSMQRGFAPARSYCSGVTSDHGYKFAVAQSDKPKVPTPMYSASSEVIGNFAPQPKGTTPTAEPLAAMVCPSPNPQFWRTYRPF